MKKLLLLLAMAVMVIGLVAGCGKSTDNGGDKKSGTIGFSVSTLNNPFFVTMKEGVEAKLKLLALKLKSLMLKMILQNKQTTFPTCLKAVFLY